MKAKDIMTSAVITVSQEATVAEAIDLMTTRHVSGLPVTGAGNQLVGVISEGDLMRRVRDDGRPRRSWWLEMFAGPGDAARDFVKARSHDVADVMTREVVSVDEEASVGEVARLLEKNRIKRVPVVRGGAVVGIVSRANLLHALSASEGGALPKPSDDDGDLRARVAEALEEVPGVPTHLLNFTVNSGNVALRGLVETGSQEDAIRVAVENVPGVRSVDVQVARVPAWAYGV